MEKVLAASFIHQQNSHHPQTFAVDDGFTFIESYPFLERTSTPFPLEEA